MMIVLISISSFWPNDKLIWSHDLKGNFTVKSCYRFVCMKEEMEDNRVQLMAQADTALAKEIWKAKIPPKIRIFGWRRLHDFVPTMANLSYRHLEVNTACFRCLEVQESTEHVIKECPYAMEVCKIVRDRYDESSTAVSLFGDADNCVTGPSWFELMLVTTWAIWRDRNEAYHEEANWTARDTALFSLRYLADYQRCQLVTSRNNSSETVGWSRPPANVVKLNFDGAYRVANSTGGIGVVAPDKDGQLLGALSSPVSNAMYAFVVEAMAAAKALQWTGDMGFTQVPVEGDALSIIKRISNSEEDYSLSGVFIIKAKSRLLNFS